MTTFTCIDDDEKPCISLDHRNVISVIEPNIYAGFTEHMGRCIYGGLYDPSSPFADENGFRKDVIDAMKELRVPAVRYPGGNFVATYRWQDGVGPKEKRPKRPELAWLGVESNHVGTDEFMKWCELVGCEPYLCFNMGTGTLEDALAWLEYCNGNGDTHYANLRRQNGHEEPYNVKYWALGNEVWGPWQVEENTKEQYAHKAWQWAKALKLFDPSIQLVLCGSNGFSSWDFYVINQCVRNPFGLTSDATGGRSRLVDMVAVHMYTASENGVQNCFAPLAAELAITSASHMIDVARIENKVPPSIPKPLICFDEWNVWDAGRAKGEEGAEEKYTLSDALAVSIYLQIFIRQSMHLGMCNIAQSINVISPLLTHPSDPSTPLLKQTTYYPLYLFSRFMRGKTLAVHLRAPEYQGSMAEAKAPDGLSYDWVKARMGMPWLGVCAVVGEGDEGVAEPEKDANEKVEGKGIYVCLAVTNLHETRDFDVELDVGGEGLKGKQVKVYRVGGNGLGYQATNTWEKREIGIKESVWEGEEGGFVFPRCSLTLLRWRV